MSRPVTPSTHRVYPPPDPANAGSVDVFSTSVDGLVPAPGTENDYFLRDDGTWVAVPAGVTPAASVVSETSWGNNSVIGSSLNYARADHTHGTPTAPTAASVGADPTGTASSLVASHVADSDPHIQYQKESEKAIAGGYASLSGSGYVPTNQLGSGTANSTKFLRGDQSWATPPSGGGGTSNSYFPGGWG